jgi:hypothetical protein
MSTAIKSLSINVFIVLFGRFKWNTLPQIASCTMVRKSLSLWLDGATSHHMFCVRFAECLGGPRCESADIYCTNATANRCAVRKVLGTSEAPGVLKDVLPSLILLGK